MPETAPKQQPETPNESEPTVEERLLDLQLDVDELHTKFDQRLAEQAERISQLEQEIADLRDENALLNAVASEDSLAVEERAAVCLQTLVNRARKRDRAGKRPVATMDYNDAANTLGGSLQNNQYLEALRRAAAVTDTDAIHFISETRQSAKNSRLVVDLRDGQIREHVAGEKITTGDWDED